MFRIVGAAIHQPVCACGNVGIDAGFVHVAWLYGAVRRRVERYGNADRDKHDCQTENAPSVHAGPPFQRVAERPPRTRNITCTIQTGEGFLPAMLGASRNESQRAGREVEFLKPRAIAGANQLRELSCKENFSRKS